MIQHSFFLSLPSAMKFPLTECLMQQRKNRLMLAGASAGTAFTIICKLLQKQCFLLISVEARIEENSAVMLVKQILSYKTLLYTRVIAASCVYSPVSRSLCATLVNICTGGGDPLLSLLEHTTSLCLHPLSGVHQRSASVNGWQWVHLFLHGGIP